MDKYVQDLGGGYRFEVERDPEHRKSVMWTLYRNGEDINNGANGYSEPGRLVGGERVNAVWMVKGDVYAMYPRLKGKINLAAVRRYMESVAGGKGRAGGKRRRSTSGASLIAAAKALKQAWR